MLSITLGIIKKAITAIPTGRYQLAFMSLDLRGRLVANKEVVFASELIKEEIEAAKILGRALATLREKPVQEADGSTTSTGTTS
jgi:hypothetical protein